MIGGVESAPREHSIRNNSNLEIVREVVCGASLLALARRPRRSSQPLRRARLLERPAESGVGHRVRRSAWQDGLDGGIADILGRLLSDDLGVADAIDATLAYPWCRRAVLTGTPSSGAGLDLPSWGLGQEEGYRRCCRAVLGVLASGCCTFTRSERKTTRETEPDK